MEELSPKNKSVPASIPLAEAGTLFLPLLLWWDLGHGGAPNDEGTQQCADKVSEYERLASDHKRLGGHEAARHDGDERHNQGDELGAAALLVFANRAECADQDRSENNEHHVPRPLEGGAESVVDDGENPQQHEHEGQC